MADCKTCYSGVPAGREKCQACGQPASLINTYDQLRVYGGDRVAVTYRSGSFHSHSPAWHVLHMVDGAARVTDPRAHFLDNKLKTFLLPFSLRPGERGHHSERKRTALEQALAWTRARYGEREFVRNAWGDYVEADVNARYPLKRRRA